MQLPSDLHVLTLSIPSSLIFVGLSADIDAPPPHPHTHKFTIFYALYKQTLIRSGFSWQSYEDEKHVIRLVK